MRINELESKSIIILGLGKEGIDTFKFLRKLFPEKVIGIGDRLEISNLKSQISNLIKQDKKIKRHLGENYLRALENYDIIIKSPGIPIHLPEIEKAFKQGKVISQTEFFFDNCPGKIIGVTGTKGKSTTAYFIYQLLKYAGFKARLVGNIGKPVLSLLSRGGKKDVFVYELSCHQLYNLKKSPHIAVLTNIYPEHLDYYKDTDEYLKAKQNITRYQKKDDFFIYNAENKTAKATAKITAAKKIAMKPLPDNIKRVIGKNGALKSGVNQKNIAAALEVAKIFNIPNNIIIEALSRLKTLPHRLEPVGTFGGITFYNDSLSTIPETAISAIDSLGGAVQTIILGGFDRGLTFDNLAKKILKSNIKNIILFPTTGEKIWTSIAAISKKKKLRPFFTDNMKQAVALSYQHTQKGKICLLSCASSSFNLFKSYKERGNLFKKYVRKYGK